MRYLSVKIFTMSRNKKTSIIIWVLLLIVVSKNQAQIDKDEQHFQKEIIDKEGKLAIIPSKTSSKNDFNFLEGNWNIHNKVLETQIGDASNWCEYKSNAQAKKIIDGLGYISNNKSIINGTPYEEIQLILFNPKNKLWSIYLANSKDGKLNMHHPFIGSFDEKIGVFYSQEAVQGKTIIRMAKWDKTNPNEIVYKEAYSKDNGNSWKWNKFKDIAQSIETDKDKLEKLLTIDKTIPVPEIKFDNKGELIITASKASSKQDFDFLSGKWKMYHKKLKERLSNNNEWVDLESIDINYGPMLDGIGNTDLYAATFDGEYFEGYTLRLFEPKTKLWSLYWVASNSGVLDPPVVGSFDNDIGHFFCKDTFKNDEVIVVFRWDFRDKEHPIWSQAFSPDKGKTWEWNWINVSYRVD